MVDLPYVFVLEWHHAHLSAHQAGVGGLTLEEVAADEAQEDGGGLGEVAADKAGSELELIKDMFDLVFCFVLEFEYAGLIFTSIVQGCNLYGIVKTFIS